MLARHAGAVVLVSGAIPGEEVRARVVQVAKGVAYADTMEVLSVSPDRRKPLCDLRCGGSVFAHITPSGQRRLKAQIVIDAMSRLGGLTLDREPTVVPSPEEGYRMRARFHAQNGRLGFYREGSHELCEVRPTRQLLPASCDWLTAMEKALSTAGSPAVRAVEVAENQSGTFRTCHLELSAGVVPKTLVALAGATGLDGLSVSRADQYSSRVLSGSPSVTEVLTFPSRGATHSVRLTRNVRSFFQSNRFLIEPLVGHVAELVPPGPVIDLYAGIGLFGLALTAAGESAVTLVEGDVSSGADLEINAALLGDGVRVLRRKVEIFLAGESSAPDATVIVDPPRTGLSKEVISGLLALSPATLVYVSCDAPTLARDTKRFLSAGYALDALTVFDLFPNTSHVETVVRFYRA